MSCWKLNANTWSNGTSTVAFRTFIQDVDGGEQDHPDYKSFTNRNVSFLD